MEKSMSGKVALVTGAASGIGRGTAQLFAQKGAKVTVADIQVENGEETVELIRKEGGDAIFVKTDVSKTEDVAAMVAKTVEKFGRLDYAFNCAGVEEAENRSLIVDYKEEIFDRVIAINLKGVWLCMKYEIPAMLENGGVAIVNCSSVMGILAIYNESPYVASKHGVIGMSKSVAMEYSAQGVRVNVVCPGIIRTPMNEWAFQSEEMVEVMESLTPIGYFGSPIHLAEATVWLCSDASSYVTGVVLPVDGGFVLGPPM